MERKRRSRCKIRKLNEISIILIFDDVIIKIFVKFSLNDGTDSQDSYQIYIFKLIII